MEEEFLGLVSPEGEEMLAVLADEAYQWKNPILEMADKSVYKTIISTIDNNLLTKVPADWANPLKPIIAAAIKKDWETVGAGVANLANQKINIPGIDELSEQLLFNAAVGLILGLLMGKVEAVRAARAA